MINNLKCEYCDFQLKSLARNKLKPFFAEARTDLGVELNFVSCDKFTSIDEDEGDNENEDYDVE